MGTEQAEHSVAGTTGGCNPPRGVVIGSLAMPGEAAFPGWNTMVRRFLTNYAERHLHPVNRLLHVVGVPLTFGVSIAMLVLDRPAWALACFVVGYALQFAGHAIEGNDAGEVVLLKRWLGKPYVEFGPRHPSRTGSR